MTELRGGCRLAVAKRVRPLRVDVLVEASAERHVERLHPAADAEYRKIRGLRQLRDLQLEGGPSVAHDMKLVPLTFAVQFRCEVRTAAGQEQTVDVAEETATGASIRHERKDDGNASKVFDCANVPGAQKVGRLSATPFLSITGVEIRCHADERFHWSANGLRRCGI